MKKSVRFRFLRWLTVLLGLGLVAASSYHQRPSSLGPMWVIALLVMLTGCVISFLVCWMGEIDARKSEHLLHPPVH